MLQRLIELDKKLLIYLNNLGTPFWDGFWKFITDLFHWIPLYALIVFLTVKALGIKKGGYFIAWLSIIVGILDQSTNLSKSYFKRLRPINNPEINESIRILHQSGDFGFYSGHATVSTAIIIFVILLLKKHYNSYIYLMLIFPLIFSYSRIYLGVHYPLDIFTGILIGTLSGMLFFKLSILISKKLNL